MATSTIIKGTPATRMTSMQRLLQRASTKGMDRVLDPGADGGTQGTVYVCPMHPEVTSNAPGALCPKCNMKLVPKQ